MKRLLCTIAATIALAGCDPQKEEIVEVNEQGHRVEATGKRCYRGGALEIVELEGHEYVLFRDMNGCGITHSGGCKCHTKKGD